MSRLLVLLPRAVAALVTLGWIFAASWALYPFALAGLAPIVTPQGFLQLLLTLVLLCGVAISALRVLRLSEATALQLLQHWGPPPTPAKDCTPSERDMIPFDVDASSVGCPELVERKLEGASCSDTVHATWHGKTLEEAAAAYLGRFRWPDPDPHHAALLRIEERTRRLLPAGALLVQRRLHFSLDGVPSVVRQFAGVQAAFADEELIVCPASGLCTATIDITCAPSLGEYTCWTCLTSSPGTAGVSVQARMQVRGHSTLTKQVIRSLLSPAQLTASLREELDTAAQQAPHMPGGGGDLLRLAYRPEHGIGEEALQEAVH